MVMPVIPFDKTLAGGSETEGGRRPIVASEPPAASPELEVNFVEMEDPNDIRGTYSHHSKSYSFTSRYDVGKHELDAQVFESDGSKGVQFFASMDNTGARLMGNERNQNCQSLSLEKVPEMPAAQGKDKPAIDAITDVLPLGRQTITVRGHGFGVQQSYAGDALFILVRDETATPSWDAGFSGDGPADQVQLIVSSWKDTEIVFGGFTGKYGKEFHLRPGDKLSFYIWNPETSSGPGRHDVIVTSDPTAECSQDDDIDVKIDGCSKIVDDKTASGESIENSLIQLGYAYVESTMYGLAIQTFDKAIKRDFEGAEGAAWTGIGQQLEALGDVAATLSINPNDAFAFVVRGIIHSAMGKDKDDLAFQDFDDAIAADRKNSIGWIYRAGWYFDHPGMQEAINDYAKAIDLDPSNWIPYNDLGRVYLKMQDAQKALSLFAKAAILSPNSSVASDNYNRLQKAMTEAALSDLWQVLFGGGSNNDSASEQERFDTQNSWSEWQRLHVGDTTRPGEPPEQPLP